MSPEAPVLMYSAAPRIQVRAAHGRHARLRLLAMVVLLALFYGLPWIQVGGRPLVWFDLPGRQFHLFGLLLVPQDLIYLTWLLVIAALTLFFFTTLAGRLWCGYACPQTVWTEAFMWIEQAFEGDRHQRLALDRAPWTPAKLLRRGGKHLAWLALGLYTGLSFVAYFVPARELFPALIAGTLGGWALFWVLFYGFATWGNAGFMREQVCKYMCPYARFQSAMFDRDTLIVAYDAQRGEPRKSEARRLGSPRGACVDCSLCVQVCPVGIDIRKGLQYECIACAACVDACDAVMDSVQQARGLIRYGSLAQQTGQGLRLLRPRSVGYGLLWLLLCAGFVVALAQRTPLQLEVMRDRHALYRQLGDGRIENLYSLHLGSQDRRPLRLRLQVTAADGRALEVDPAVIELAPGDSRSLAVSVRSRDLPPGLQSARFQLVAEDDPRLHIERQASYHAGAPRPVGDPAP
ncbi:MAG TPA: cytochrome c oxidase accessory protein CcoG [Solimonas sp.]|nr:cytochrome c oxidase accessory protein CcoG [Solimonas sp.]